LIFQKIKLDLGAIRKAAEETRGR